LAQAKKLLLNSSLFTASSGDDIYAMALDASKLRTYWFVSDPPVRLMALLMAVAFAMPVVLGLCYAAWRIVKNFHELDLDGGQEVSRLILWTFAASWLGWYVLFSIGWDRYLFPAMFFGSVFAGVFVRDVAGGFGFPRLLRKGADILRQRRFTLSGLGSLLAAIVIPAVFLIAFWLTVSMLFRSYTSLADGSALETARFLNQSTVREALIETIDVELFFLLERPYHHPPDSVRHELNRRTFLGKREPIDYDPMISDPDYLVIGPHSRMWRLYDSVLTTENFRLLRTYPRYEIYQRVR
jgi:hypothetical protein